MLKVYIDCRETQLINLFVDTEIDIIQKQLDVGDIMITNEEDVVLCIIERKTLNDLLASIKDGRYKEQHSRLVTHFHLKTILYILEGYVSFGSLENKSIESSIIHTLFRDETKLLFTRNVNDTFFAIQAIIDRIIKHPEYFQVQSISNSDERNVCFLAKNLKKSSNDSKQNVNKQLFCQLPGISIQSASALQERFGSFVQMFTELKDLPEDQKNRELNLVKVNGRKLNKLIVENIIKYVF
jgi:ERCC4-type nuclease